MFLLFHIFTNPSSITQNIDRVQHYTLLVAVSFMYFLRIFCFVLFVYFLYLCLSQPWMKDVLYFLKSRLSQTSDALRKKVFVLTTTTASNAARKKRAGEQETSCVRCKVVSLG